MDSYITPGRLNNTNVSPANIIQTINSLKRTNYLMRQGKRGVRGGHLLEALAEATRATSCQDCSKRQIKMQHMQAESNQSNFPGEANIHHEGDTSQQRG